MSTTLPLSVQKYFWGDNLNQLNWQDHQKYITQTLLDKGDIDSLSWLFSQVSKADLSKNLSAYKLSTKSLNFWKTYLS